MDRVSYMTDFLAVRLLFLAERAEKVFEECLMSCPKDGDRLVIDNREVFTRLLDERLTSLFLSMAAVESYLGYLAHGTGQRLADKHKKMTLREYIDDRGFEDILKTFPNRLKRRHQLILEESGDKPLLAFLVSPSLSLEEKFIYWTLIRTGKLVSFKDGYVKKFLRIMGLAEEVRNLDIDIAPQVDRAATREEIEKVFLRHPLPEGITPGKSASDLFVTETYAEGHLLWELLHCFPARMVQEIVQYLHKLDDSENHFIIAVQAEASDRAAGGFTVAIKPGE